VRTFTKPGRTCPVDFGAKTRRRGQDHKRLREENARLKKLVAERDLEVEVMKEIQAKKW